MAAAILEELFKRNGWNRVLWTFNLACPFDIRLEAKSTVMLEACRSHN
jgi:hypothetical protein